MTEFFGAKIMGFIPYLEITFLGPKGKSENRKRAFPFPDRPKLPKTYRKSEEHEIPTTTARLRVAFLHKERPQKYGISIPFDTRIVSNARLRRACHL